MEHAPKGQRGRFGACPRLSTPLGLLLTNGALAAVTAVTMDGQFLVWGWHIPHAREVHPPLLPGPLPPQDRERFAEDLLILSHSAWDVPPGTIDRLHSYGGIGGDPGANPGRAGGGRGRDSSTVTQPA
ncbi:hypothetical protein [Streptomyces sp. S3(2020)]|uniref:hypothetical protein n=1 Tax=Streptomyces sp. S3(2020) TaxID=2732044 RepID=UPI0019D2D74D|nr:hypothetical protein [Streptomyces sp. S3(2020)]